MNLLNKLIETEDSKKMSERGLLFGSYEDMGFRLFEHIKINDKVSLSVQASYAHYCQPRKTLPLDQYESMELAILKNNKFASVDKIINDEILIEKLNEFYEGTVYGCVPVELLEQLYQKLLN